VEVYTPRLLALLRQQRVRRPEARDLLEELPGLLAIASGGGASRTQLARFDGRGSLFAFLSTVVLRAWWRARGKESARNSRGQLSRGVVDTVADPASIAGGYEASAAFARAMDLAWRSLSTREQLVLVCRFVDGLKGAQIAALLGVGEPRVSRLVEHAIARLSAGIAKEFPSQQHDLRSVWRRLRDIVGERLELPPGETPPPLREP
jgi:RNA polymerase sigma factor (sigma-70 family)